MSTVTFTFSSMAELADHLEAKARSIRSRVARASTNSQHVMRAEAHAYEQSAMIVRNSLIEEDDSFAVGQAEAAIEDANEFRAVER